MEEVHKALVSKMVNATVYPVNNNFHSPRFPAAPGNIILLSVWDFDLSRYLIEVEKAMAPHSSTLAWKIPWMEEPSRPQSMGSLRVGHD